MLNKLSVIIGSLVAFSAQAADYSFPMGTVRPLEISTSVTGSGNLITELEADIETPSGSVTPIRREPRLATYYNAAFVNIPLNEYGTYRVTVRSHATGPGGRTSATPIVRTVSTFNPFEERTYTVQYQPVGVPAGWIRPGNTYTGNYRLYQFDVPSSFHPGVNARVANKIGQAKLRGVAAEIQKANPSSIQAKVTVSNGQNLTKSIENSGNWSFIFN